VPVGALDGPLAGVWRREARRLSVEGSERASKEASAEQRSQGARPGRSWRPRSFPSPLRGRGWVAGSAVPRLAGATSRGGRAHVTPVAASGPTSPPPARQARPASVGLSALARRTKDQVRPGRWKTEVPIAVSPRLPHQTRRSTARPVRGSMRLLPQAHNGNSRSSGAVGRVQAGGAARRSRRRRSAAPHRPTLQSARGGSG
jgi:hypothetical protein